jgi:hypothetical protein
MRSDRERLLDILEAIENIERHPTRDQDLPPLRRAIEAVLRLQ